MTSTSESKLRALSGGQYTTTLEPAERGHPQYVVRRDGVELARDTSKRQAWAMALSNEIRMLRQGNAA